jgi:hypothetical protein
MVKVKKNTHGIMWHVSENGSKSGCKTAMEPCGTLKLTSEEQSVIINEWFSKFKRRN